MKNWEDEIKQKLDKLEDVPERNPLKVQSLKRNFMSEARKLSSQPVVVAPSRSWWNQLFQKKETFPMKLVTIGVILSLLLGGGISAVAAQSSLPGDALYPVKTLVEDLQLELTTNPETEFEIALQHAWTRFEEIQELVGLGEPVEEAHIFAYQVAFQRALKYGLETEDPIGKLLEVQQQLKYQEQMMHQGPSEEGPYQQQMARVIAYQGGLVDASIDNPELLSTELQFMSQYSKQYGEEKLEDVWMNLYMFGATDEEGLVGEVQNQGEIQHPVEDPFMWMHLQGNRLTEINPDEMNQGGETGGAQNSFNDHPNGGNQGDNGNGGNGGAGGNGGK